MGGIQRHYLDFIELARSIQNGLIDRINGRLRRDLLDWHVFRNLSEVREQAEIEL